VRRIKGFTTIRHGGCYNRLRPAASYETEKDGDMWERVVIRDVHKQYTSSAKRRFSMAVDADSLPKLLKNVEFLPKLSLPTDSTPGIGA